MTLPNLDHVDKFALDIETKDMDLKELGPGPRRKGNYILGVAIATNDREWYFPVAHPRSENLKPEQLYTWLRGYQHKDIILAHALYDLDWLQYQNIKFTGKTYDVQIAEPLIDENKFKYDLDSLGEKYIGRKKEKDEIAEICKENKWRGDPRQHLWKLPADIVGKYATVDVRLTYDVFDYQLPILESQELMNVFSLETRLIPLLLYMRKIGVRIDVEKQQRLKVKYAAVCEKMEEELYKLCGMEVNIYAAASIKQAFDKHKIPYNYTKDRLNKKTGKMVKGGNPTFASKELEYNPHPIPQAILRLKKYRKAYKDFICGIEKFLVGGRIHTEFTPVKGSSGGTVSGRFSSSRPNLQNQPSRDEEIAHDIRSLFIPEEGYEWLRGDYSQIEYRMLAHYARGVGAGIVRDIYNKNPKADFHQICADMIGIDRKPAKNINFGIMYTMGKDKLKKSLGLEEKQAEEILSAYNARFPFVKKTSYDCQGVASRRGYVKTILGRRRRFLDKRFCYRALNSVLQGSAADVLKAAMVTCWESGIYATILPHITVHDEMGNSYKRKDKEALIEMKNIFENTIKFKVPIRFKLELGPNWAELEECKV